MKALSNEQVGKITTLEKCKLKKKRLLFSRAIKMHWRKANCYDNEKVGKTPTITNFTTKQIYLYPPEPIILLECSFRIL